jgi:maltose alpha-D-glucosyltransferase/alpha-amylase
VFGRGSIEFIPTDNRKVLTYVRRYEQTIVLCVANLSRTVQPVALPLQAFAGLTPVEMLGETQFPRIGEQPYFLTLGGYGFYWFQLQEVVVPTTSRVAPAPEERLELPTLFAGVVWDSVLDGSARTILERHSLATFLQRQRWFGGKARAIARARFSDWTTLRSGPHPAFLTIVDVDYRDGGYEQYALPLAMSSGADADAIDREFPSAIVSRVSGARKGLLYDGLFDDDVCRLLLAAIHDARHLEMRHGRLRGTRIDPASSQPAPDAVTPITRTALEQSNTSVVFARHLIMKMFRRIEYGPNPDVEIGEFLTRSRFTRVPPLRGTIDYVKSGSDPAALLMLQDFVINQGNGWHVTIEELGRYFERVTGLSEPAISSEDARAFVFAGGTVPPDVAEAIRTYIALADVAGRCTGELHVQLAQATEPAFKPEPYTAADLTDTADAMRRHADEQLQMLEARLDTLDPRTLELARAVIGARDDLMQRFADLAHLTSGGERIRCHGDYHLGQILITEGEIVILDFEGEPARSLAARRTKCSALRDVAGMLRSFSYAALTALNAATRTRPDDAERLTPWARLWETWVSAVFMRAYLSATRDTPVVPEPRDTMDTLLHAFIVDKALYELGYELNNRPDWVHIPLSGLRHLRLPLHA